MYGLDTWLRCFERRSLCYTDEVAFLTLTLTLTLTLKREATPVMLCCFLHICLACSPRTKLMLGTGLCGGFTTFSTVSHDRDTTAVKSVFVLKWFAWQFAVDAVTLFEAGQTGTAAAYIAVNNVGGVIAALLPLMIHRRWMRVKYR